MVLMKKRIPFLFAIFWLEGFPLLLYIYISVMIFGYLSPISLGCLSFFSLLLFVFVYCEEVCE